MRNSETSCWSYPSVQNFAMSLLSLQLDKETQTFTPNTTVRHVGLNTASVADSGENQNLVNKLDASSNTSLYDDYQENANTQTVISFDNHNTIVSKSNFVQSAEAAKSNNCSQMFNQPHDKPFVLITGEPFSEFNVNKLTEATKFTAIGQRLVKYYGEFSYSYGNNKHPPCPIPEEGYLAEIVEKVRQEYPYYQFNSVLVTKYTDGHSHLPMHSDDELDIADNSHILTVSLGAGRLRDKTKVLHKHTRYTTFPQTPQTLPLHLSPSTLSSVSILSVTVCRLGLSGIICADIRNRSSVQNLPPISGCLISR